MKIRVTSGPFEQPASGNPSLITPYFFAATLTVNCKAPVPFLPWWQCLSALTAHRSPPLEMNLIPQYSDSFDVLIITLDISFNFSEKGDFYLPSLSFFFIQLFHGAVPRFSHL
jgi:hypothetical protein